MSEENRAEEGIRINKYLADSGICSRREADRQIEEGNVTIDGKTAGTGDRVMPGQQVLFNGIPAAIEEEKILIAFNKPVGIVCTAEKREKDNVIDYLNYPKRIYPVGRLDKDSEGLLLLTNQGEIVNKMMRSGNKHEKEYIVTLTRPVSESLIRGLRGGVPLVDLGVTTRECFAEQISKFKFRIILTQGYNRQIRRMCDYFGYHVKALQRVRVMNIELGDLAPGQYRDVTPEEYKQLMWLIRNSSNAPVEKKGTRRPDSERMRRPQEEEGISGHREGGRPERDGEGHSYRRDDNRPKRDGEERSYRRDDNRPKRDGEERSYRRDDNRPKRDGEERSYRRDDNRQKRDGEERSYHRDDNRPKRDGEERSYRRDDNRFRRSEESHASRKEGITFNGEGQAAVKPSSGAPAAGENQGTEEKKTPRKVTAFTPAGTETAFEMRKRLKEEKKASKQS